MLACHAARHHAKGGTLRRVLPSMLKQPCTPYLLLTSKRLLPRTDCLFASPPNHLVHLAIRVRVKIMGLIIIRTD
jgi:hypothetical protein